MTRHDLVKLGVGTLVAVLLAFWATAPRSPQDGAPTGGMTLLPGLRESLNDITRFRVVEAGDKAAVTLVRADAGWQVVERGGYPADIAKVRETLIKFANSKLVEAKTSNPERHGVLGVEDVAKPEAKGMRVEIDGKVPAKLVIGTYSTQGNGTFVRRNDEAQAWLAQDNLVVDREAANWLDKELADIASDRIMRVEIERDGKLLAISKTAPAQDGYIVENMPAGRELLSQYEPNGLASVLAALRFEDVAKAEGALPEPASVIKATYRTFDGMVVVVTAFTSEGKHYATFKASVDPERADIAARAAQLNAVADHKVDLESVDAEPADIVPDADAAQKEGKEPTAETPLAVTDPAASIAEHRKAVDDEAARLNQRSSGWIYVLPAFKYANINKSLEDLLKPKA